MKATSTCPDDEEYVSRFPNEWREFVTDAPKTIPHIHDREGSARWMIQTRRAVYVNSGALRKSGKKWLYNPRKFVRTWLSVSS